MVVYGCEVSLGNALLLEFYVTAVNFIRYWFIRQYLILVYV